MDVHFANEEFDKNIPVLMGLIDIWHRNFWNYEAKAILPYAKELKALPAYLQQLEMEGHGVSHLELGNLMPELMEEDQEEEGVTIMRIIGMEQTGVRVRVKFNNNKEGTE